MNLYSVPYRHDCQKCFFNSRSVLIKQILQILWCSSKILSKFAGAASVPFVPTWKQFVTWWHIFTLQHRCRVSIKILLTLCICLKQTENRLTYIMNFRMSQHVICKSIVSLIEVELNAGNFSMKTYILSCALFFFSNCPDLPEYVTEQKRKYLQWMKLACYIQ